MKKGLEPVRIQHCIFRSTFLIKSQSRSWHFAKSPLLCMLQSIFPFLMWMYFLLFTSTMFYFHVGNDFLIVQNSYIYAMSINFRYSQKNIQLKLTLDSSLLDSHIDGRLLISSISPDERILIVIRLFLPLLEISMQ